MFTPDDEHDTASLLNSDPTRIQEWIRERSHSSTLPQASNWWLGLAEAAAEQARSLDEQSWGAVAVLAYMRAMELSDASGTESIANSAMMLRAHMISRLGPQPGDFLLDPDVILEWFRVHTTISPDDLMEMALDWRQLDVEAIRELRKIKNRLNVLKVLAAQGSVPLDPEWRKWLQLTSLLP